MNQTKIDTIRLIDTINVKLVSDEYAIKKENDIIILIEQQESKVTDKNFFDSAIFTLLIIPVLIISINLFINWIINRKRDKATHQKTEAETARTIAEEEKIKKEIKEIKKSFQPIVLTTIQKTQEYLIEDKIFGLKTIANFYSTLFNVENIYDNNGDIIGGDEYDFYNTIYSSINKTHISTIREINSKYGHLYTDSVLSNLKTIEANLIKAFEVYDQRYKTGNIDMPKEMEDLIKTLSAKFKELISEIRKDLHIDNHFVHDFIRKYNNLED